MCLSSFSGKSPVYPVNADIAETVFTCDPLQPVVAVTYSIKKYYIYTCTCRKAIFPSYRGAGAAIPLASATTAYCWFSAYSEHAVVLSPRRCLPVYARLFLDRGFADNTHDALVDFHDLGCIQEFRQS